ncbi:cyclopropane-fatty-acyl-phospholipid synthase [Devosia pacifica]|uniref:Cyclopropane-fatty-acyl-phospholipid synthase n=1 Tax=Devosia pacifica TaxID=1335967 RepID=A0A918S170_9HYPH|nr:cyclopropane fatty acyl phospholipid synthase [Devosia pacifica]GHA16624.1 cyclopropane-fatty-acyl-phospholipid synthase [Devosia pacifica]
MDAKPTITRLLADAGITVNGPEPWDIQVHDERLYQRFLAQGTLGFGEAYMDGWWDVDDMAEFFNRAIRRTIDKEFRPSLNLVWQTLQARILNMQTVSRSRRVAEMHYSETDAYKASLDKRMTGSCGYWPEGVSNVDEAQEAKLDMVCRKIGVKPGQTVWDIGCGWGAFMGFAAEKYGANCVGVTVSPDQAAYGRERYKGLPIEFQVKDYREFTGKADHVVSMGMFEHVGYKNYRAYFEKTREVISDDGLFMLHTIGSQWTTSTIDPWLEKYIFPGGVIPSMAQIGEAIDGLFTTIDVHNIGPHYDRTLVAWYENFDRNWPRHNGPKAERFYRMWKYYLLCCAGGFRARAIQVWQFVFSPSGVPDGYLTQR